MESGPEFSVESRIDHISQLPDFEISRSIHVQQFLQRLVPQDCVWVFDFDGNLIHKGFNSFSPIDRSNKDTKGELLEMKKYMVCIESATNSHELQEILQHEGVVLPLEVESLLGVQDYQTFKDKQMDHRWLYTMQKAVEWQVSMNEFDLTDLKFRPGAKTLLSTLLDGGDQVLIISSGVGNLVRHAIQAHGYDLEHPGLHIKANDFTVDSKGLANGFDPDLITPFTKMHVDYHKYGISDKSFAVQSGDSLGDSHMVTDHFSRDDILNIGFTNGKPEKNRKFPEVFDVVAKEKQSSFEPIQKLILG